MCPPRSTPVSFSWACTFLKKLWWSPWNFSPGEQQVAKPLNLFAGLLFSDFSVSQSSPAWALTCCFSHPKPFLVSRFNKYNLKRKENSYSVGTKDPHIKFRLTENSSPMFLLHKLRSPVSSVPASSCYAFMYMIFPGPTPPHTTSGSEVKPDWKTILLCCWFLPFSQTLSVSQVRSFCKSSSRTWDLCKNLYFIKISSL